MSSLTPGSANSSRYLDFDEYVELKLQKTGASIKTTDILIAAAGVATMFLAYLLTFIVFDQWIIPGHVPHTVVAVGGPAVALDVFYPIREDYLPQQPANG